MKPFIIAGFIVIAGLLIFNRLATCNRTPKPGAADTIRQTITKLIKIPHYDTIIQIRNKYSRYIDTVAKWVTDSTAWLDICRSAGISANESECKRVVLQRLAAGRRDSTLVEIYDRKRRTDSTVISALFALDSLNRLAIDNCEAKAAKSKRRARITHAIAAVVGVLILVK